MYLGLPTAISRYNLFPSLITLTSGGQFASRDSRILCNTLHKEREASFSCKRTDTDRLGITEGGMNPAFRSPRTVRLKPVRAVRFPVLSARFPLSIFSFPPFLFVLSHPVFLFPLFSISHLSSSFLPSHLPFILMTVHTAFRPIPALAGWFYQMQRSVAALDPAA